MLGHRGGPPPPTFFAGAPKESVEISALRTDVADLRDFVHRLLETEAAFAHKATQDEHNGSVGEKHGSQTAENANHSEDAERAEESEEECEEEEVSDGECEAEESEEESEERTEDDSDDCDVDSRNCDPRPPLRSGDVVVQPCGERVLIRSVGRNTYIGLFWAVRESEDPAVWTDGGWTILDGLAAEVLPAHLPDAWSRFREARSYGKG